MISGQPPIRAESRKAARAAQPPGGPWPFGTRHISARYGSPRTPSKEGRLRASRDVQRRMVHRPAGIVRAGDEMERSIRCPIPAYLIETDTERILDRHRPPPRGRHRSRRLLRACRCFGPFAVEQDQSIADQVDVTTITKVVLTHLHWDHCSALPSFPKQCPSSSSASNGQRGTTRMPSSGTSTCPVDYAGSDRPIELVDGDHDSSATARCSCSSLRATRRDTSPSRSVTSSSAADVTHFASGLDDHRFPLFGDDHAAQGRSADRLKALRDSGQTVLPGHDPDVLRPGPVAA